MTVSLKKSGFSLGEIEAILAHMFGIHATKRATFSARLQQLQRLGLPPGAQPGRGKRFRYEFWQVADFALYLDLLDAGIPPNLLKVHLSGVGFYGIAGAGQGVESHPPTAAEGRYLVLELRALTHMRSSDASYTEEHAADHVMKVRSGFEGVEKTLTEGPSTPAIVMNLSVRLADLKAAVGAVLPSHVEDATFGKAEPRPGSVL